MTIRQQILKRMTEALGEAEISSVRSGDLYRWSLERHDDLTFYVTVDGPEHQDFAHILLSDGTRYQANAIESVIVYDLEQTDALITRILRQWKANPRRTP